MSIFESDPPVSSKNPKRPKECRGSSRRFMAALEAWRQLAVGNVTVEGLEKLQDIPPDKPIVFAVSHISDLDVPLAACVLGKNFDLGIADQSVHHSPFGKEGEFGMWVGLMLAGKENFFPIDVVRSKGEKRSRFHPENFDGIASALEGGKAILFAAHNPSKSGEGLNRSGVGVAYLTTLTNVAVVPIAISFDAKKIKPNARVSVGSLMEFQPMESAAQIAREGRGGDKSVFRNFLDTLRDRSESIIREIAEMLPDEQKGFLREASPGASPEE